MRLLLAFTAIAAGVWDLRSRRIPNWLTLGALVAGLVLQAARPGWSGLASGLAGAGVALAICIPLFALRALGGGDVKLMAAAGVMTGASHFVTLFVVNAVAGGVAALAVALLRARLWRTLRNVGALLGALASGRTPHSDRPELDIANPEALTLPRGAIFGACALLMLVFGPLRG